MEQPEQINPEKLPSHIAIIMDGNGRWAQQQGHIRTFGHQNGVVAVRDTVEGAAEIGIQYLSMYAFSTENWKRPRWEVDALMELLIDTISKETKTLMDNNIRLMAIGDTESLPANCRSQLKATIDTTASNTRMTLILALSYSSRWEITRAAKNIASKVKDGSLTIEEINDEVVSAEMCTSFCPDPELLIRTSGEHRISNFMLWQLAYTELYFTDKLWPDFRREDLKAAIIDFQKRDRRYGMVNEQESKGQNA
ncbi:MAG TPA: isoprenyl transferase [Bacteroidia bacterium]|nr:isoprenyl transferase [Bacteroidia bacterium]